jgi:hypothetical protein
MRKTLSLRRCLLVALAFTALCLPSLSQNNIRLVIFVKVRMGQEENWKAAAKDYGALAKKAGVEQGYSIWTAQTGPQQHAIVWYFAKWKDLDGEDPKMKAFQAEQTTLFSRLDSATESLTTWIEEVQSDLSISSKDIPHMVRLGRTRVVPGKMDDVKALFRDQILPAIKKSGATDYSFAEGRYGTPTNEIHTVLGMKGWADLDSPIGAAKGMSADEFKALQAKLATLTQSTEWSLWTFEPDFSYLPPSK